MARLRTRRINGLLEPLAPLVGGEVADGRMAGSYHGYSVEAVPRTGYPLQTGGGADTAPQPASVNTFRVTLSEVSGASVWRCQSSPGSLLQGLAAQVTAGRVLRAFRPGEFRFEGVDTRREVASGAWLGVIRRMGIPAPAARVDQELQERLIAAGLFEELAALRWGGHPYLPKAAFTPPGRELARGWVASGAVPPGLAAALGQHMAELDRKSPGRLVLEVEIGRPQVPSPERFRELLEAAARIARINAQANSIRQRDARA